jgi:hypothetical protein
VQRYKNKLIYANIFLSRRILLQKLRIGFADAIGIVDGIARDEERHCHAMVVAGEVLAHSKQAVGLFDWERVGASGMEGDAEALEFNVVDDPRLTDIPLKDLKLKDNILIVGIVRDRKTIIPGGNDVIRSADKVVVIAAGHKLSDLSDILR